MSGPHHPEIARMVRHFDSVRSLLDEQVARMHAESFVASDQTGTVEVTVDGYLRLVDLHLDPRIVNLGAQEVATRINEALSAATQFASDCVAADVDDLEGRVADVLATMEESPPPR